MFGVDYACKVCFANINGYNMNMHLGWHVAMGHIDVDELKELYSRVYLV